MLKHADRIVLSAAFALLGLTPLTSSASASRSLSLNPAGAATIASLGRLTFNTTLTGTPVAWRCNVTLHGSLSRVLPKLSGTLFGKITGASVAPCDPLFGQPLSATALVGTPWKLRYQGFTGSLPSPSSLQAVIEPLRILFDRATIGQCLYEGIVGINLNLRGSAPNTNGLVTIRRHNVPLRRAVAGSCGANLEFVGVFALTPTQTVVLVN